MAGPLLLVPLVAGAVAGVGVEKAWNSVFGGGETGTKKGGIANVYHEPYEQYAPTITDMRQVQLPDYQVQVDSPFARQDMTKKQSMEPEISGGASAETGINPNTLMLIAAGGLVLYGVTKK